MRTAPVILMICLITLGASAAEPGPGSAAQDGGVALDIRLPDLSTFALIRTDGGKTAPQVLSVAQAADFLAAFDVVVIGEAHRHVGSQLSEMALFRAIHERAPDVSLSMEQFERDVQPVLDDYLTGKIGELTLGEKGRTWQSYGTTYRPIVEYAKEHHLPVIAANAPEQVITCVGREGLAFLNRMKPATRGWVAAEIHAEDGPYRAKFMGFAMGDTGHGGGPDKKNSAPSPQAVRAFEAQVTRDDTMAESIFLHLQAHPGRKVVHLTGSFHSDDFLGTVERLRMRAPALKIAVVSPTDFETAEGLVLKADDAKGGTVIVAIRSLPEPYATPEEMKAAMRGDAGVKREGCKL